MNCTEVEARLVDVVDGRLDPVATVRLHAHIEGCADCRTRAAFWRMAVPKMRGLAPEAPNAMGVRRMQVEIDRLIAADAAPAPPAPRRWPRLFVPATLTLVGAAAILLALRVPSSPFFRSKAAPATEPAIEPATNDGYATLTRITGTLTIGGRAQAAAARVPPGREIVLASATEAELSLDRGSTLRIDGPARLRLGGTARAVEVRLDAGTLDASVAHRLGGETFAVATPDLHVEVRGTKFVVAATATGSSVRVSEGRVAVRFADGSERPVAAGESASWPMPAPPAAALPIPGSAAAETRPAPTCGAVVRACEEAGRAARRSMRSGDAARALRLIVAGTRDARDPDGTCASSLSACEDELRYLRAEAFRQEGSLDEAIAAYHQLDRHGAPAAMRQNALYAAAQIEERQGRKVQAHSDYERALGAAPEGALREEALFESMESAAALGNRARARQLARRYLETFPSGLRVATARRLAGSGTRP